MWLFFPFPALSKDAKDASQFPFVQMTSEDEFLLQALTSSFSVIPWNLLAVKTFVALELLEGPTIAHEMNSIPSHKPGITHAWVVSFCKRL